MKWIVSVFVLLNSMIVLSKDSQDISELEQQLLDKYRLVQSARFKEDCVSLVKSLQLKKINDCFLLESEDINAFVLNNGHVYFTSAVFDFLNNRDQWASIIAHENAHLVLDHYSKRVEKINKPDLFFTKSRLKKFIKKQELEADEWAESHLLMHQFDPHQVRFFLLRVEKKLGKKRSKFHLKINKRIHKNNTIREEIDNDFKSRIESYFSESNQ